MRLLIIFIFLFLNFSLSYAVDVPINELSGIGSNSEGEEAGKSAAGKIGKSLGEAKSALSHKNARNTSADVSKESGLIDGFKNNLDKNLNTIMGKGDEKIYSLDSNSSVNGKLYCAGQDEIADIYYSKDNKGLINMNINISKQGTLSVYGIAGICSDSFMICDKKTNQNLCSGFEYSGLTEEEIANHPCKKISECMNWNFKNSGKKIYLDANGSISCPVSSDTEALTSQISAVLSSAYFTAISDIKESADKSNVKLYSLNSSQCGEGGDTDSLGIGGISLDELSKIYESGKYPDGATQLSKEKSNDDSLFSLLDKSRDNMPDLSNETGLLDGIFGGMEGEFNNPEFIDSFITDSNSCYIQKCTVEKSFSKNNVNYDGSTNASLGNQASITTEIRECINNSNKYICPIEADEQIITNCSCDNPDELSTNLGNVLIGTTLIDRITDNIDEICNQDTK